MGRRGPVPAPTAMKLRRGVRADRINREEPVPGLGAVIPPPMSEEAREVWDRLAPPLIAVGVLTPWDVDMFAHYCEIVVVARTAAELVQGRFLARGRRGGFVTSPARRAYRDAVMVLRALAQEFGLTPSARSQIRVLSVFTASEETEGPSIPTAPGSRRPVVLRRPIGELDPHLEPSRLQPRRRGVGLEGPLRLVQGAPPALRREAGREHRPARSLLEQPSPGAGEHLANQRRSARGPRPAP